MQKVDVIKNDKKYFLWRGRPVHIHSCVKCLHFGKGSTYCNKARMLRTKGVMFKSMEDCEYWENKDEDDNEENQHFASD